MLECTILSLGLKTKCRRECGGGCLRIPLDFFKGFLLLPTGSAHRTVGHHIRGSHTCGTPPPSPPPPGKWNKKLAPLGMRFIDMWVHQRMLLDPSDPNDKNGNKRKDASKSQDSFGILVFVGTAMLNLPRDTGLPAKLFLFLR